MSHVGFSQAGNAAYPSPAIWGDCPNSLLNDLGLGRYRHVDFLGAPTGVLAAALDATMLSFGDGLSLAADTDTVLSLKAAELGGYLDIETDGDDNDAFALLSEPLGKIVRNSGKKMWFEARVEVGDITNESGYFFGLIEELGASVDGIADNALLMITESHVGFWTVSTAPTIVIAQYAKAAATPVVALATAHTWVNNTEVRLGVRFNGRETITWYVNGVKVAVQDVDSTVDQSMDYCVALIGKNGTGAAQSAAFDWVRYAYQENH